MAITLATKRIEYLSLICNVPLIKIRLFYGREYLRNIYGSDQDFNIPSCITCSKITTVNKPPVKLGHMDPPFIIETDLNTYYAIAVAARPSEYGKFPERLYDIFPTIIAMSSDNIHWKFIDPINQSIGTLKVGRCDIDRLSELVNKHLYSTIE